MGDVVIPLKTSFLVFHLSPCLGNTFRHFFKVIGLILSAFVFPLLIRTSLVFLSTTFQLLTSSALCSLDEVSSSLLRPIFHQLCKQAFSCKNSTYLILFNRNPLIPPPCAEENTCVTGHIVCIVQCQIPNSRPTHRHLSH